MSIAAAFLLSCLLVHFFHSEPHVYKRGRMLWIEDQLVFINGNKDVCPDFC